MTNTIVSAHTEAHAKDMVIETITTITKEKTEEATKEENVTPVAFVTSFAVAITIKKYQLNYELVNFYYKPYALSILTVLIYALPIFT